MWWYQKILQLVLSCGVLVLRVDKSVGISRICSGLELWGIDTQGRTSVGVSANLAVGRQLRGIGIQ